MFLKYFLQFKINYTIIYQVVVVKINKKIVWNYESVF